jgi:tetratricopeptide (TPR) repeat protein
MKKIQIQGLTLILWAVFSLVTPPCFAQSASPLNELESGNYQALEKRFSEIQTKFEKGNLPEFDLLDAYKLFYQRQDKFLNQLNSWIEHYPKSSSAYLARGIYFRKLGDNRRGTKFISEVPEQNIKYMEKMHKLAIKDLNKALQLDPKSYLAVLHLLNIALFDGDDRSVDVYMRLGNKLLPSNLLVNMRYLIHLAPRWGGSYGEMEKFINESRRQGLSPDTIHLMQAIEYDDRGSMAVVNSDYKKAIPYYLNALIITKNIDNRIREHYLSNSLSICQLRINHKNEICP